MQSEPSSALPSKPRRWMLAGWCLAMLASLVLALGTGTMYPALELPVLPPLKPLRSKRSPRKRKMMLTWEASLETNTEQQIKPQVAKGEVNLVSYLRIFKSNVLSFLFLFMISIYIFTLLY